MRQVLARDLCIASVRNTQLATDLSVSCAVQIPQVPTHIQRIAKSASPNSPGNVTLYARLQRLTDLELALSSAPSRASLEFKLGMHSPHHKSLGQNEFHLKTRTPSHTLASPRRDAAIAGTQNDSATPSTSGAARYFKTHDMHIHTGLRPEKARTRPRSSTLRAQT